MCVHVTFIFSNSESFHLSMVVDLTKLKKQTEEIIIQPRYSLRYITIPPVDSQAAVFPRALQTDEDTVRN